MFEAQPASNLNRRYPRHPTCWKGGVLLERTRSAPVSALKPSFMLGGFFEQDSLMKLILLIASQIELLKLLRYI